MGESANLEPQMKGGPPYTFSSAKPPTSAVLGRLTDKLLVPNVQSHVPQGRSHGADHPVVVYPQ